LKDRRSQLADRLQATRGPFSPSASRGALAAAAPRSIPPARVLRTLGHESILTLRIPQPLGRKFCGSNPSRDQSPRVVPLRRLTHCLASGLLRRWRRRLRVCRSRVRGRTRTPLASTRGRALVLQQRTSMRRNLSCSNWNRRAQPRLSPLFPRIQPRSCAPPDRADRLFAPPGSGVCLAHAVSRETRASRMQDARERRPTSCRCASPCPRPPRKAGESFRRRSPPRADIAARAIG
jgi:hypothetical protein